MTDADDLHDVAYDALVNEAPEVKAWDAEQDKGVYSVVVRGVPGAYLSALAATFTETIERQARQCRGHRHLGMGLRPDPINRKAS